MAHGRQIFHDPSGGRRRWTVRVATLAAALALVFAVALTLSLTRTPPLAPLRFAGDGGAPIGLTAPVTQAPAHAAWLPAQPAAVTARAPEVVGFYMGWDTASRASLDAHVGALDWVVPGLANVTGPNHRFTYESDAHLNDVLARANDRPGVLPMVQNAMESGEWDGRGTAALLADPAARTAFLDSVERMIRAERGRGVVFDLENLPETAQADYRRFLSEARRRFAPQGWLVTLAVPVADPAWDLAAYAEVADRLFIMAYDQHWPGGAPGPIAAQPWFAETVAAAVRAAGPGKAIVALGSYAYDWPRADAGATSAEILTVAEAWARARAAGITPRFDPASGNSSFAYRAQGVDHHVWMLDAASAANEMKAVARTGATGIALWRLGSEDPGFWTALTRPAALATTAVPPAVAVESRGLGEILRLDRPASDGARTLVEDDDGLIRAATWTSLPSPAIVRHVGAERRLVALTFDDGPDPRWTPRILDSLRRLHAPATFFVTGTNALGEPDLLRRIVAEGHELGNHSTTHPDLTGLPVAAMRLELLATQRLVEAYTGRSLRLFRAPYLGDADPDTAAEIAPIQTAAELGYVSVGLHVDPLDWSLPDANQIVRRTIDQVAAGSATRPAQIVLLHDSGGNREATIRALPGIVQGLRARGYEIVPVSRLAHLRSHDVMPPVAGGQGALALVNRGLFHGLAGMRSGFGLLFALAIGLGMARSIGLTALALARRPPVPDVRPHLVPRFVSVLIPAFNEARVIEASVRRILATEDIRIEVIVIDDGSTDGTSAVIDRAFALDPRVELLTLENGGKARALNEGLKLAKGAIVIALDADTQFEPQTIARLARWFADPGIGAVAGNAKIGNAVNLITRWQAVEYVTAQNLERRALDRLGAITVVPGAVGAWRRTALDSVGGYPEDTLAEDQDLTISVQRAGWRVACDIDAIAWTEAPETARALYRQRHRWAYGTLQALWKHRGLFREHHARGLARIGLPQAWLFQVGFTLLAPLIDVALVASIVGTAFRIVNHGWAEAGGDVRWMALFWALFTAVDLACGWAAFRLDPREERFPALRLLAQRFGYRQLMYWVVLRACLAAITGPRVTWGKLERSGRVTAPALAEAAVVVAMPSTSVQVPAQVGLPEAA